MGAPLLSASLLATSLLLASSDRIGRKFGPCDDELLHEVAARLAASPLRSLTVDIPRGARKFQTQSSVEGVTIVLRESWMPAR